MLSIVYMGRTAFRQGTFDLVIGRLQRTRRTMRISHLSLLAVYTIQSHAFRSMQRSSEQMDSLLQGFKCTTCICYLDSAIVFSSMFDTHIKCLSAIQDVFHEVRLQMKSSKCHFGRRQTTVPVVYAFGLQPDPEKVSAVKVFSCTSVTTCLKHCRTVLILLMVRERFRNDCTTKERLVFYMRSR